MSTPTTTTYPTIEGLTLAAPYEATHAEILTAPALRFLVALHRHFDATRRLRLEEREQRKNALASGARPTFLAETEAIRQSDWQVAPIPSDLLDRRVEITGPPARKMVINALNSGAKVFMADFEDANAPTWSNTIAGQVNLRDAVRGTITYTHPTKAKTYTLDATPAVLFVRPRGWHLEETYVCVDGAPMSASLFDFGLYFFHNAKALLTKGSGPYFYLPKLENHLEARLWNEVFVFAQDYIGIPQASIKATVLIEHILAAFEMHEILYELRDHSAGLNCGRWDYIFSMIKSFATQPEFVMPNRAQVTMQAPCMRAYSQLVIQTCHRRGVHAMGGMAAQIPVKNDPKANEEAFAKVKADKQLEAQSGHDGTWVAHPGLVQVAQDTFDQYMPAPNQLHYIPNQTICAEDLLQVPQGTITEAGVRENINVGLLYIEYWLRGQGAAALYHKMEDAATAEISRAQLWQWIHHKQSIHDTPQTITLDYCTSLIPEELLKIKAYVGETAFENGRFEEAQQLLKQLLAAPSFPDFLTLMAYPLLRP